MPRGGVQKHDCIGQRFGRLLVRAYHPRHTARPWPVYECVCDCGEVRHVPPDQLVAPSRKRPWACVGCCRAMPSPKRVDLAGQTFGRLTALGLADEKNSRRWRCRCDCGRELVVFNTNLTRLHTTSCGCLGKPSRKPKHDLVGRRFGRLTVLEHVVGRRVHGQKLADTGERCRCDCGRRCFVQAGHLLNGRQVSCGCHLREMNQERKFKTTHGESQNGVLGKVTKEYRAWILMRRRCHAPACKDYSDYGGRGIRVCDRWMDGYEAFIADVGRAPSPGHSLDRIDVDGHYEPGNVRWATVAEQMDNRRCTIRVTLDGQTLSLRDWCKDRGLPYSAIHRRLTKGWAVERALTTPVRPLTRKTSMTLGRLRGIWNGMKRRCTSPRDENYRHYGGRGITVCARWAASFEAFHDDIGSRPSPLHSVGRIDNDGGYWCGREDCLECGPVGRAPNCRWETPKQQAANQRRAARLTRTIPRNLSGSTPDLLPTVSRYSLRQIATLLDTPLTTLRWHKRKVPGRLPEVKTGAAYDKATVDAWLTSPNAKSELFRRPLRPSNRRRRTKVGPKTGLKTRPKPVARYRERFDNWYVNMNGKRYFLRVYGRDNGALAAERLQDLLLHGEAAFAALSSPEERTARSLKALAARWGRSSPA